MGNTTPALNHNNKPSELSSKKSKDARLSKSIGPFNVPFIKMNRKCLDELEDQNFEDEQLTEPELPKEEEEEQCEIEDEKGIEEVKIKWNSFIKMKKKSYLQEYTVINQIGRGGFGTVSKVKAKYTGVIRAAKKIKKSALAKGEHQKLFAEMAIMITLDHPNIARLFEVYDYKSSYVLILELCEGGELFKKIITKAITEETAALVMAQLLQALMYLHSRGIVHRDIKPENMLFQKDTNNLKLIDFGIAANYSGKEPLTARIGTPYYIAPEVLCKQYSQKCDIWSAGVILYMMLCFRPPFNGDNETEVMENILRIQPSYKGHYFKKKTPSCLKFLQKLLVKNPLERPSALQAYENPWIQQFVHKNVGSIEDIAIENISTFKFANKLQAVVFTYIVSQILTSEEKSTLKALFQKFDKNHDGVINAQQLRQALLDKKDLSEERINFLMRVIDTNGSGEIDFTEFIVAGLQPGELSQTHFEQAFAYFDIDHSGMITYDEIAAFLEDRSNSEEQIYNIFKDVDENHDGEISREEFIKVLTARSKERLAKLRRKTTKEPKKK